MNYPLLEKLTDPLQLRDMTSDQLEELASELRARIAEIVRENGGHLGPNLGAVEIIMACHLVFDLKKDRLIFDVGHQAYPHKLLTNRNKEFDSLRQLGGISGYPHQGESPYDVFRSGHASTSISTALGIQTAFSEMDKDRRAIALIGDGSMTGGMAFEGMNHAGHIKNNLIVILNDNSMSISPTVGGMANTFNEFRHGKVYNQFRDGLINNIKRIPKVGDKLENVVNFVLDEAKTLVNPGQIFTTLGFDYYGPLNGNSIQEVSSALRSAMKYDKPVLIHAITEKGKDYMPEGLAGEKTIGPHALSPGQRKKEEEAKNGGSAKKSAKEDNIELKKQEAYKSEGNVKPVAKKSYSKAFTDIITKLSKKNSKIMAITAAMSEGTGLNEFGKEHPDKFIDVGICEGHAVGFSAGLSSAGKYPVFAVYSTFLQRGFDQLFHDVVLQDELGLTLCIDRAGLVGDDGPSHHGVFDIAYLRLYPKFIVMAPKNEAELEEMMNLGIGNKNPVAIRYPRDSVPAPDFFSGYQSSKLELGKAEILKWSEKGSGVAIFAYGFMNMVASQVEKKLASEGIDITLVNARFAKPIDAEVLKKIDKHHHTIIVIEEGTVRGGLGSGVLETCNEVRINSQKVVCCGVPDRLIEHASRTEQLAECGLDEASILKIIHKRIKDIK